MIPDESTESVVEQTPPQVEPEPTLADIEKEGAELRSQLISQTAKANDEAAAQPAVTPDEKEQTESAQSGAVRNEKGQFVKKEQPQGDQPPQAQPEATDSAPDQPAKPESNYEKAKKEAARKDKTWKQIEAEKEAVRSKEAELQRQYAAFQEQQRQLQAQLQQQQAQRQQQDSRFSPEEFERAADWYDNEASKALKNGDLDKFEELSNNAKLTRKAAKETASRQAQIQQQQYQTEFARAYEANAVRVFEKDPDAANPDTELGKKIIQLLQNKPILQSYPEGFADAYELIKLHEKAAGHDDAVARAEKAEKEVARLNKLMQPGSGGPVAPSANSDNAETMPLDQLERKLRSAVSAGGSLLR